MKLVALAHPHRRALFVLLGLLCAAGINALFTSARSIYPRVAFPRIAVIAELGEAPVRGVMASVTRPIEQAVSTVPELVRVRSRTTRGACELALDFRASAEMRDTLSLVRARIAASGLPAGVSVTIEQQTPAIFPVMSFNVLPGLEDGSNPVARARLAEWAELELKPRLARLPDTFLVTVQSGDRREYVFDADPVALAAARVGIKDVRTALAEANTVEAVGRSASEGLQYQLLVDGQIVDPRKLLDVAVRRAEGDPVRLADLGTLTETTAERTTVVTGGGTDGVVVSVFLRDGGRVTRLSEDVTEVVAQVQGLVPGKGTVIPVYDQAQLVNDSIAGVRDAIAIGAVLAVVVMALFLASFRITVVAGLSIPLSVLLTLAVFPVLGESLNLMSLGGLAVAIGLIIDDTIVVVENVARRIHEIGPAADRRAMFATVSDATGEVFGAIVGSSLTTVVVLLPLVLLEGVVGQFFRSLALALGVSIVASTIVSLVYAPLMLLIPFLTPRSGTKPRRWMAWIQDRYARATAGILAHPWISVTVVTALLVLGISGIAGMETGFLPEMDEGGFVLDYTLPVGTSLAETDATCRRIEAILLDTPEVASFSRRTGAELGLFATEQFTGDFLVGLKPREARHRSVFEIIDELRHRVAVEVPQSEVEFIQVMHDTINDLAGNPDPIEVKLVGDDYRRLQKAADDVAATIERIPGIVDVKNHVSFGSPELSWRPDPMMAMRLGLSTEEIAGQASAQLLGEVATRIQEGDRFVDVRVRYPGPWRATEAVEAPGPPVFVMPQTAGGPVPLSSISTFSRSLNENELERENQIPMVRVTAATAGRDLGSATSAVERAVAGLVRPSSVRVEYGGQSESQKTAFRNLIVVFGLGTGLVFLLLVLQFRSLTLPLVMFLALPFGQIGGLYALRATGIALNISSGMGLVMLVGLVVKNGIIMIEYAQQLRRSGLSERDAIIEAARTRLRPVLMTTLAAIAGLLPLALGLGSGSELQKPPGGGGDRGARRLDDVHARRGAPRLRDARTRTPRAGRVDVRRAVLWIAAAVAAAGLSACRTARAPCLAPGWSEPDAARPLSHADCVDLAARWAPNRAEWQARLMAAQAALRQACAFPNPTLGIGWEEIGLYSGAATEKLQTTASLAYALDAIVSRPNRIRAARGELGVQEAAVYAEWQKLAAGVHHAYDELVAARARVLLERDLEAVASRQRDAIGRIVASGIAPRIADDRAEVELLSAGAERIRAEARARVAELELAFALGFSRPVALVLSEPMTSEPAAAPDDLGALLAEAADARPELKGAAARIRAELARLQIAMDRVQFLPTIGAGPRTKGGGDLEGVASIDLVLPLSDSGEPAEAAASATLLEFAADARKEAQKVASEVCLASERLRSELVFLDTHARELASRRTALREQTERMFAAGEASSEDVVLARRDEVTARINLLDAELAAAGARVDLKAALGRLSAQGAESRP